MLMRHQPIAGIGRVDQQASGVCRAYHRVTILARAPYSASALVGPSCLALVQLRRNPPLHHVER